MSEPPVFWERRLAEVDGLRAEVAGLRDALRMRNVGIAPLLDLIARLRDAVRELDLNGEHLDLLSEADSLVPNEPE